MGWLVDPSRWAKRSEIVIDSSKVDDTLTNFPLMLRISAASGITDTDITDIFDDLGANSLKIAVTLSDGTTQCYVEIEKWNNVSEDAILWVKVPSVSSSVKII
jgi:hypothetical protein